MATHKPWRYARNEKRRRIKLRQKAQKLGVLDQLPKVIRSVWSYNARRRRLNSIAHGQ